MTPPDPAVIARSLNERQRDFLSRVYAGKPLRMADRVEDRARQSCRKLGLAKVESKPRRWVVTDLYFAVRNHLEGKEP